MGRQSLSKSFISGSLPVKLLTKSSAFVKPQPRNEINNHCVDSAVWSSLTHQRQAQASVWWLIIDWATSRTNQHTQLIADLNWIDCS